MKNSLKYKWLLVQSHVEQTIVTMRAALNSYRRGTADFADAVIGHGNRAASCETTYTFDRKAARLPEFMAL